MPAQPEPQAESEPEAEPEAEAEAESEPEAESEAEPEAEAEAEAEPESEPEAEPAVEGATSWTPRGNDFHGMDCTDIVVGMARGCRAHSVAASMVWENPPDALSMVPAWAAMVSRTPHRRQTARMGDTRPPASTSRKERPNSPGALRTVHVLGARKLRV